MIIVKTKQNKKKPLQYSSLETKKPSTLIVKTSEDEDMLIKTRK